VYAKYAPREDFLALGSTVYSGILMDDVLAGQPQLTTNAYTITPEIKELAVDGLRMRIKLAHRYTVYGIDLAGSTWNPSTPGTPPTKADHSSLPAEIRNNVIVESDWETITLGDALIVFNQYVIVSQGDLEYAFQETRNYLQTQTGRSFNQADIAAGGARTRYINAFNRTIESGTVYFSLIKREFETANVIRDFRELTVAAGQQTAFIDANTTKISEYDIIIPNEDFQPGDQFNIGALVGQFTNNSNNGRVQIHTLLQSPTQWSITDASQNVDADNNEIE